MAITPPGFNVAALSPASLLNNKQDDGLDFDQLLGQIMSFQFNSRLQDAGLDAAMDRQVSANDAAAARDLRENISRGYLVPRDSVDPNSIGASAILSAFDTGNAEDDYVTSASVSKEQQRFFLNSPFTVPGETVQKGVRNIDVYDANGQLNTARANASIEGSVEELEILVAAVDPKTSPKAAAILKARLDIARGDDFFSQAEQDKIEETYFDGVSIRGFEADSRAFNALERAKRAELGSAIGAQARSYEEILPDGTRAPAAASVNLAIATRNTGGVVSAEQQMILDKVDQHVINLAPRLEAWTPKEFLTTAAAAGTAGQAEHLHFISWLAGYAQDGRGGVNPQQSEMVAEIRRAGYEVDTAGLTRFALDGQSSHYRQAYAMYRFGVQSNKEIERLRSQSVNFPIGLDGVRRVMSMLDPSWYDGTAGPSKVGNRDYTAKPPTAAEKAMGVHANESAFKANREAVAPMFAADPVAAQAFKSSLQNDEPETLMRDMLESSRRFEAVGDMQAAATWRGLADMLRDHPTTFYQLSDSVLIPAIP